MTPQDLFAIMRRSLLALGGEAGKGPSPEEGPSNAIWISRRRDPQLSKELLDFIAAQTESRRLEASVLLDLEMENMGFALYRSKRMGNGRSDDSSNQPL